MREVGVQSPLAEGGNQVVKVADSCVEASGADSEVAGGVAVAASRLKGDLNSWASLFGEGVFKP